MKAHNVLFCANRYVKTLCRFTCSLQSAICPVCVHARESEREGQKKKERRGVRSLARPCCVRKLGQGKQACGVGVRALLLLCDARLESCTCPL